MKVLPAILGPLLVPLLASAWAVWRAEGEVLPPGDSPSEHPRGPAIHPPLGKRRSGIITGLAFAPDGKTLATADGQGLARVYDASTVSERAVLWQTPGKDAIRGLAYSPDGAMLAVGFNTTDVALLDASTGHSRRILTMPPYDKPHTGSVLILAYAPDGKTLAGAGLFGQIALWDVTSGRLRSLLRGHWLPERTGAFGRVFRAGPQPVTALAYSPDGVTLASAAHDHTIRFWNPAEGKERFHLACESPSSLAYSSDGRLLASGLWDGTIRIWDTATWRCLVTLTGHRSRVSGVAFLPGGATLASLGADQTARLWDVSAGHQRDALRFEHHSFTIEHLSVSPDGRLLAAGGYSSTPMFGAVEFVEIDGMTLRPWKPRSSP